MGIHSKDTSTNILSLVLGVILLPAAWLLIAVLPWSIIFYCILGLVVIFYGIGLFLAAKEEYRLKREREQIANKTLFVTRVDTKGFTNLIRAVTENNTSNMPKVKFTDNQGVVGLPKYSKCRILEYCKDNRDYVLVKFEDYDSPLYIRKDYIRTPKELGEKELKNQNNG